VGVQVNDGPAEPAGEIREETRHGRRLPGHGDFDLSRMVRELRTMGVSAPWAVEVMSDDLATKELRAACRLAFDATTAMLESAHADG